MQCLQIWTAAAVCLDFQNTKSANRPSFIEKYLKITQGKRMSLNVH